MRIDTAVSRCLQRCSISQKFLVARTDFDSLSHCLVARTIRVLNYLLTKKIFLKQLKFENDEGII